MPSADLAIVAAVVAGGKLLQQPQDSPWGRRAVLADPDGHRVELTAGKAGAQQVGNGTARAEPAISPWRRATAFAALTSRKRAGT